MSLTGVSIDSGHGVEMPVMWLYQLQDGTLGPASNGIAANPIVARIAFWTDDDTCKINTNTAGDGAAWNTPRVNSTDDVAWSTTQPAAGEYSRYPGHPAMTSLAVVFGSGSNPLSSQQLLGLTPRYAYGGSEFGTKSTLAGEVVPPKTDRLYASLDELCFSASMGSTGQRQVNPVTPGQIDVARFVLTDRSRAPETTMLGEPRVAIWPVSDAPLDSTRTTPADRAMQSVATVGSRNYFFQRHNAQSTTDDLSSTVTPGNVQLFNDLVARGARNLPGTGANFAQKYPGANWSQIVLEMTDFIRSLNAVDPTPAPFVSYAAGDSTRLGQGFVEPLTTTYGSGATAVTLRGLGRCPTLSSLTIVFYVCGFGFDAQSHQAPIDYETTPDDATGSNWQANFALNSPLWPHVTSELVRAFVVPCTFPPPPPGCGYPEVGDNCSIQISGLNGIGLTTSTSNDFGFPAASLPSHVLNDALGVPPAERAWGGNEGPLAWRASAQDQMPGGSGAPYAFAGTKAFTVPLTSHFTYNAATGLSWPITMPTLVMHGAPSLTVTIRDGKGNTLQTLNVTLPANVGVPAPTLIGEYSQRDGAVPVMPSYYMTLKNRLLATQANRPFLIQPGDTSRSMEAATDLRVIAGLASVPAAFFKPHPAYLSAANSHAHNLRFADGTAVYGASGMASLVSSISYATATTPLTWTDWRNGSAITYAQPVSPPCSCPTEPPDFVAMEPLQNGTPAQNVNGDWDTGRASRPTVPRSIFPTAGPHWRPPRPIFR